MLLLVWVCVCKTLLQSEMTLCLDSQFICALQCSRFVIVNTQKACGVDFEWVNSYRECPLSLV